MPYHISLEPSGKTFVCGDGETILKAALKAGIRLPYECSLGNCSTCKGQLLEGDVRMLYYSQYALLESERAVGFILCCQSLPMADCVIEIEESPLGRDFIPLRDYRVRLAETQDLTHDTKLFTFEILDGVRAQFRAGQYIRLRVPGTEQWRAYSMSNSPSQTDLIEFVFKRVPNGLASNYFFDHDRRGEEFDMDGPYGEAYLREDCPRDILCIAGGSGISPMLSILRRAFEMGLDRQRSIQFFFGGRTTRDMFYLDLMQQWQTEHPRYNFIPAISHPTQDDLKVWKAEVGLITDVVERYLPRADNLEVYMAGPPPMIDAALDLLLKKKGIRTERVHFDKF